jgi:hypothetical protein
MRQDGFPFVGVSVRENDGGKVSGTEIGKILYLK